MDNLIDEMIGLRGSEAAHRRRPDDKAEGWVVRRGGADRVKTFKLSSSRLT